MKLVAFGPCNPILTTCKRWICFKVPRISIVHAEGGFMIQRAMMTIIIIGLSTGYGFSNSTSRHAVTSPDGSLSFEVLLVSGTPFYRVGAHGISVIDSSRLGFRFRNKLPLMDTIAIREVVYSNHDETWEPVWGIMETVRNRYNELTIRLVEEKEPFRMFDIVGRAYNDGVAFRYILPEQEHLSAFEITSEETEFRFTDDHQCWWIPADYDSYEYLYRESRLSEIEAVNTPITMKTDSGLLIAIHEAQLVDYAGMTLKKKNGKSIILTSDLVPWPDGVKVRGTVPHTSPWRTIQIAQSASRLMESQLILNVNDPCVIEDVSWITPMKYMGIWWGMHIDKYSWHMGPKHGATTENTKRYMDFAADHDIPGVLVEGWNEGWETWGSSFNFTTPYPDFDVEEITSYGRERGVSLIGHHETGADVGNYESQLDSAFAFLVQNGIPAVKTGYVGRINPDGHHHHGQWMVNHYRRVIETAAKHRIMLNVHEPIKPTGISRTFPNMMTREGGRGQEYNAWSEGNPPDHTTILPFTRFLAGPMDYTPGIFNITFDEYKKDHRVHGTIAKELALYVILFSPLQMAADLPEHYEGNPGFQFIEQVPVTWDETVAIDAVIGDYVIVARRSGDDWYLGCISDEEDRDFEISLGWLESDTRYTIETYTDGEKAHWITNPTALTIETGSVTSSDTLVLDPAPGGGCAVILRIDE